MNLKLTKCTLSFHSQVRPGPGRLILTISVFEGNIKILNIKTISDLNILRHYLYEVCRKT